MSSPCCYPLAAGMLQIAITLTLAFQHLVNLFVICNIFIAHFKNIVPLMHKHMTIEAEPHQKFQR